MSLLRSRTPPTHLGNDFEQWLVERLKDRRGEEWRGEEVPPADNAKALVNLES
jgi:hypothetical protein